MKLKIKVKKIRKHCKTKKRKKQKQFLSYLHYFILLIGNYYLLSINYAYTLFYAGFKYYRRYDYTNGLLSKP